MNSFDLNHSANPKVVIIGAGFGGLRLGRLLANKAFEVVILDRNNYHQFQPLMYQVATSGLAPSDIAFPIRKVFQNKKNIHFRVCEVEGVNLNDKLVRTSIGEFNYDFLVIATGAITNFFGNKSPAEYAFTMKSIEESLAIRNRLLENLENALSAASSEELEAFMNVVIVGGGPTGVELAGAISEMRTHVLPKDYPELDFKQMNIYLIEAGPKLLCAMKNKSSVAAERFLKKMNVIAKTNAMVESFNGNTVLIKGENLIRTKLMVWAAGVKGSPVSGFPENIMLPNGRIKCDQYCRVEELNNVFAIGDVSQIMTESWPKGHPQLAQTAMQQAKVVAHNITRPNSIHPFHYKDYGSMATVGRSKAAVDLPGFHFHGFFAWLFWLFIHLMNILGVKNRLFIFIDWMWYYISFDQSLRLLIRQKKSPDNSGL